jgi:hypothetical protein
VTGALAARPTWLTGDEFSAEKEEPGAGGPLRAHFLSGEEREARCAEPPHAVETMAFKLVQRNAALSTLACGLAAGQRCGPGGSEYLRIGSGGLLEPG